MGNIQYEKSGITPLIIIYLSNSHFCTRGLGIFSKLISKNTSYANISYLNNYSWQAYACQP